MFTFPFGFMGAIEGGGVDGTIVYDESFDNVAISTIPAATGLTGDSKDYTVVSYFYNTSNDEAIDIEVNGDTSTTNYTKNWIRSNNSSTSGDYSTQDNDIVTEGFAEIVGMTIIKITGSSGDRRLIRTIGCTVKTSSEVGFNTTDTQWENTVDEINSIKLTASTTTALFSGRIVVYEHGKIGDAQMGNLELIGTKTFSASAAAQSFTGLDGDTDGFYRIYNDLSIGNMELKSNINTTDSDSGRSNVLNSSGTLSTSVDTTDIPDLDLQADVILSAKSGAERPMKGNINALLNTNNANTYNWLDNTATNINEIIFDPDVSSTGSAHLYKATDGMFDTMPFELVETKNLVSESADPLAPITFSGLTGDSEFLYKLTGSIIGSDVNFLHCSCNNDQSAGSHKRTTRTNISSTFNSNSKIQLGGLNTTDTLMFEYYIYPNKADGVERPILVSSVNGQDEIIVVGGMWDNTVDELTSLALFSTSVSDITGTITLSKLRIV